MQRIRFRIDLNPRCSLGPGKIELLEAIHETGSIRQAALKIGMSYRYAWLLVDSINRSFAEPATAASVGGSGGGGVRMTSFGMELVRRYRQLSARIEMLAESEFADLAAKSVISDESPRLSRKKLRKSDG